MDWSLTVSGAALLLNALVIGFCRPWLSAYGGEKGKNIARKEDLDAILAEVRAVTIAQKEIESQLSGALWSRQALWNEKKLLYAEVLNRIHDATRACHSLLQIYNSIQREQVAPDANIEAVIRRELNGYATAETELIRLSSLVQLFAREETALLLVSYLQKPRQIQLEERPEKVKQHRQLLLELDSEFVRLAKIDLEIVRP
jgi:hypothetical protein